MKKTLFLVVCMFVQLSVFANDDKPITVEQLPAAAQQFIKTNFAGESVILATVDKDFLNKSYDVMLKNGTKLEFDDKGDWTEVDCNRTAIPAAIVPQQIKDYVQTNFTNEKITKIERDSREYDVDLSNGIDITFNKKFQVVDIDR